MDGTVDVAQALDGFSGDFGVLGVLEVGDALLHGTCEELLLGAGHVAVEEAGFDACGGAEQAVTDLFG